MFRVGQLQAEEAIAKGASAILGPTINIQRSPLGGRGFESYSEDPYLSGELAAQLISGMQDKGVLATIKHFVCNDQEDHRQSADSIVSQRALREIYLKPFQIAQFRSEPQCYMTAYNKVNGTYCSESSFLLQNILRDEWGFSGMVMSDWQAFFSPGLVAYLILCRTGTYSTAEAVKAGLDLEMPGPAFMRGRLAEKALSCNKLSIYELDICVRRVLEFIKKAMRLGLEENAPEKSADTPETAKFLRELSAESIVLLKNDSDILPFKKDKKTIVIGPNAAMAAYCGGGSAALDAYYTVTPLQGISSQCSNTEYTLGAPGWKKLPFISNETKTKNGKEGLDMTVYLEPPEVLDRRSVDYIHVKKSDVILLDYKCPGTKDFLFYADIEGSLKPDVSGEYDFSLSVAGTAKLFLDGVCIVDNATKQTRGESYFGTGTIEEYGSAQLEAGKTYNIKITFGSDPTATYERPGASGLSGGGVRIGMARRLDLQAEISKAKELAKQADQVIICAGLNSEWESEGFDREHMNLPPGSNELIEAVSQANPNTVVVLQSGTPVSMPWVNKIPAILQAWYGGNECGNAIADVIFGDVNPSGKLPITYPVKVQDNPAYLNSRSQRNRIIYGEDVFVGYRYYEAVEKEVLFPFGHGLSYTKFKFSNLLLELDKIGEHIIVSLTINNEGSVSGSEVVQIYIHQLNPSVPRPPKELKGFLKVGQMPGEGETFSKTLRKKDMTSFWDEERNQWIQEKGEYEVLVGTSSASTPLRATFKVDETTWWSGL